MKKFMALFISVFQVLVFYNLYTIRADNISKMDIMRLNRKLLITFSITELVFILLIIPLMVTVFSPNIKYDLITIARLKNRYLNIISYLMLPMLFPAVYLYSLGLLGVNVISVIFFVILYLLSINFCINYIVRDTFFSLAAAYLVYIIMIGGVILINPVIEWIENPAIVINIALMLNPLAAVSSAISLDIMRTDPLYDISSVSAYQFKYPDYMQYCLFYGIISIILHTFNLKRRQFY